MVRKGGVHWVCSFVFEHIIPIHICINQDTRITHTCVGKDLSVAARNGVLYRHLHSRLHTLLLMDQLNIFKNYQANLNICSRFWMDRGMVVLSLCEISVYCWFRQGLHSFFFSFCCCCIRSFFFSFFFVGAFHRSDVFSHTERYHDEFPTHANCPKTRNRERTRDTGTFITHPIVSYL